MTVRQLIPEGLAQMAPGPELATVLVGLDISALDGSDVVEVLRARARQLSHEQAQFLAVIAEVGWCDPVAGSGGVARLAQAPEYAADEIRAALSWTRTAAYREHHFAQTLLGRMPAVFAALNDGTICRSKAWLFAELCAELTDEQLQVVCDRLLPKAGGLTTGELAARIKKLAIALDPEWAARRYTSAVRDRDVIGYLDEDGAATVTGRRLPADQAAAACARIEDLAKAAKRAGHRGRIGALRAEVYLGLLDGRWAQHTREQILTDLLTDAAGPLDPTEPTTEPTTEPEAAAPEAAAPEAAAPAARTADTPQPARAAEPRPGSSAAARPGGMSDDESSTRGERVGVEVRLGLGTLLGLDRHPGEIPGWGPVTAETARTLVAAQHGAQWRFAITDSDGQLLLAGLTRHRPAPIGSTIADRGSGPRSSVAGPRLPGGVVELHVPAALLTDLAAHPDLSGTRRRWAAVIADLAAQYRAHRDSASTVSRQHPTARFAGVALRRHIEVRDRVCVYPGCRCPARQADLDHTLDHAHGGTTTHTNIGPLCRHDHLVKHDGRWQLRQPEPGHFVWTSPLGRTYPTRPQPLSTELPAPLPGPAFPDSTPVAEPADDHGPILSRPPPKPQPPPSPEQVTDPDEPPPF